MGVGLWSFFRPPAREVTLASLLQGSWEGPLVAPPTQLASVECTPFLGKGWQRPGPTDRRPGLVSRDGEIFFYLTRVEDLQLGISAEGHGEARLLLNGKPLGELPEGTSRRQFQGLARASQMQPGRNTLRVLSRQPLRWDGCYLACPGATHPSAGDEAPEGWGMPFGCDRELLVESGFSRLDLEVEPWVESGCAPTQDWSLEVDWGSSHWSLRGAAKLNAPEGSAILRLRPRGAQLLPGQWGLLLRGRLQSWTPPLAHPRPTPAFSPATSRPNLVLCLVDTLRRDHVGVYSEACGTPQMRALAREGVVFEEVLAQSSWTKPSVASILTSQPPLLHGCEGESDRLREELPILPEVLSQAGYRTGGFSANPVIQERFGFSRGFEEFQFSPMDSAFHLNQQALEWVDGQRPFFLYMHYMEPHSPYSPPRRWRARRLVSFEEVLANPDLLPIMVANYDGEIAAFDSALGQLVEGLQERGLYSNTTLMVLSDHGEEFLEHGHLSHANSLHSELLRVPWIVKYAHREGAGTRAKGVWQHIDVAPTLLASIGIQTPPGMQGLAYRPGRLGDPARPAYFSLGLGRTPDSPQRPTPRVNVADGVRCNGWVLLHNQASSLTGCGEPLELFELAQDSGELRNRAFEEPEMRLRMWSLLRHQPRSQQVSPQNDWASTREALRGLQYLR